MPLFFVARENLLKQALDLLTANNDLTYTKTANLYRITPIDHSFLKMKFTNGLLTMEAREGHEPRYSR
jgi:hypothetical protein